MSNADTKLLFLGAAGLIGGFFVGGAAIEGIQRARLQSQMQGPVQQRKTSALDDAVRFFGICLGLYTLVTEAPELIETTTKLITD